MTRKAFDILPPYPKPKTYHHHDKVKKERRKSKRAFLYFLFGIFFIIILFGLVKFQNNSNPVSSNQTPTPMQNQSSQFELFNDEGGSNLTNEDVITIRLSDGTVSPGSFQQAKDILLKAGFQIEKTEKAANTYDQTIIYYKNNQIAQANKVNDVLKKLFTTQLQESTNLESTFDCLVIVGKK